MEKFIKTAMCLCLIGAIVATGFAGYSFFKSKKDMKYDDSLQSLYAKENDGLLALDIDFDSLKKRNADTVGWIYLPETIINYPVVQCDNNQKYLNQRFDGAATEFGTIFADHRSNLINGNNIILYGHNQSMFNPVKFSILHCYLNDPEYVKKHSYFEFYDAKTGKGTIYDVFAVLRADITTQKNIDMFYRDVSDKDYKNYLEWLQKQTLIGTDIKINPENRCLILSTCTDDAYWQRVLVCCLERKK